MGIGNFHAFLAVRALRKRPFAFHPSEKTIYKFCKMMCRQISKIKNSFSHYYVCVNFNVIRAWVLWCLFKLSFSSQGWHKLFDNFTKQLQPSRLYVLLLLRLKYPLFKLLLSFPILEWHMHSSIVTCCWVIEMNLMYIE